MDPLGVLLRPRLGQAIDRMGHRVAAAGRAALPADDQEAALGTAALGAPPEVDAV